MHVTITIKVVKELRGSATIKRTAKEYHNQMDFREGSITVERTARACSIQNDSQGYSLSQSKGNVRGYHNQHDCEGVSQLKGILGSITIKMTAREYNALVLSDNKNDCN